MEHGPPERWKRWLEARLPRYTSYPTADRFDAQVDAAVAAEWLAALDPTRAVSLYVHLPFCHALCWYCGCHTTVPNRIERVDRYLEALEAEMALVERTIGARVPVAHLHFGGGTPNHLDAPRWRRLMRAIRRHFELEGAGEIAVELDPRLLDDARVAALAHSGVTRASLGVQDFAPEVQRRINREQPFDLVARAVERLRSAGIARISFDLMYGLPGQTAESVVRTARRAASLAPDRLAVFGYAHVPWMKPHQRMIDEAALPDAPDRYEQARSIALALESEGYAPIGFDHYARPDDALAVAAREGRLNRNFQGYTDDVAETLIGLGASAISELPAGYVQNTPRLDRYREAVMAGRPAAVRGAPTDAADRLRRTAIRRVLTGFVLDFGALAREHGRDERFFDDALAPLHVLARDGLVEVRGRRLAIAPEARFFARHVAACFDAYRRREEGARRHSLAV